MTPASRELFRQNLLMQLAAAAPYAVPTVTLLVGARAGGFAPTEQEIGAELAYLEGKGLVKQSAKIISPEIKRWEITATGRDYLAEAGLA